MLAEDVKLGAMLRIDTSLGGMVIGRVTELDQYQLVLTPLHRIAWAIYPSGYRLGRAHWPARLHPATPQEIESWTDQS